MNKGYAFGFLIVLLIVLIGMYVAYTGFQSAREAQLAQASAQPTERPGQATRPPTRVPARASATLLPIITPSPQMTATLAPSPAPTEAGSAPDDPTQPPEDTAMPEPTARPRPTATSQPAFQFRVLASRPDPNLPGCCYIRGTVRDATGNLLEGVRVQLSNQWNAPVVATSKGGPDLGKYDFPIGNDKVTWYVAVVDAQGNKISSEAVVQFDASVSGQYNVDWQRTY